MKHSERGLSNTPLDTAPWVRTAGWTIERVCMLRLTKAEQKRTKKDDGHLSFSDAKCYIQGPFFFLLQYVLSSSLLLLFFTYLFCLSVSWSFSSCSFPQESYLVKKRREPSLRMYLSAFLLPRGAQYSSATGALFTGSYYCYKWHLTHAKAETWRLHLLFYFTQL